MEYRSLYAPWWVWEVCCVFNYFRGEQSPRWNYTKLATLWISNTTMLFGFKVVRYNLDSALLDSSLFGILWATTLRVRSPSSRTHQHRKDLVEYGPKLISQSGVGLWSPEHAVEWPPHPNWSVEAQEETITKILNWILWIKTFWVPNQINWNNLKLCSYSRTLICLRSKNLQ